MWDAALLINFKTMQLVRAPSRAFFFLEKRMPNWRTEYRRCDNCRSEYRPQREAQSYCSRDCRRAAAYGRERFNAGTVGRRRRRLEASDKLPVRNGVFFPIETGSYRPTTWIEKLNQAAANEIDRAYWTREQRNWPVDLMGGHRQPSKRHKVNIESSLRPAILDAERVLKDDELTSHALPGDDIQLQYHEDGHPKLPDCLDRRPLFAVAQAA
jgi:hypothetical protein